MAIPSSKNELLDAIEASFAKLDATLDTVPVAAANDKTMPGHAKNTMISPADLVAYLIGRNELVLKWLALEDAGQTITFPETGYQWNELGALAQKFYTDYQTLSFDEKRQRLTVAKQDLIDQITNRSDAEIYGPPWYRKYTK